MSLCQQPVAHCLNRSRSSDLLFVNEEVRTVFLNNMDSSSSENIKCYFHIRDYKAERTELFATKADVHPLSSIHGGGAVGAAGRDKGVASVGAPLTRLMEGSDPLSAMAALDLTEETEQAAAEGRPGVGAPASGDDWPARRRAILAQFTTSQLVTVTTRAGDAGADTVSAHPASRAQARLAQLEPESEDASSKEQLTQQEFIAHTGRLRKQLQQAWQADQRVKALKTVIQACKLLEEVASAQFYPTIFVLVTDILDVFGELVYSRVITKDKDVGSEDASSPSSTGDRVGDAGRETCRNWIYKIASIRELVARFYVETAVLRCHDLLQSGGTEAAARRLVSAARGLADPLVAGYARCYLSRVAPAAVRAENLQDLIVSLTYKSPPSPPPGCSPPLGPAVDWVLASAVGASAPDQRTSLLATLLGRTEVRTRPLLLMALLRAAGAEFLSSRATQTVEAVAECDEIGYRRCELLAVLGSQLTTGQVPPADRLNALNAAWRLIEQLAAIEDYMHCVPAWCGYVAKYFGHRQLRVLLRDVLTRLSPDRQFETHSAQLEAVLVSALAGGEELHQLALLPSFTSLLELLESDEERHQRVSLRLLQLLTGSGSGSTGGGTGRQTAPLAAEPALLELGMSCCRALHDSVTVLSLDDERRETAAIITAFMRRAIDLTPQQLESSLDLLVQARGSFCSLESVTSELVLMALSVVAAARRAGRRRSLLAAGLAYCFVTVPALEDVLLRTRLYTATAQLALACRCPGQADACARSAISCVTEIPAETGPVERRRATAPVCAELVRELLSTLLVFPDHPSQPPLYLVRGLLTALDRLTWLQETDTLTALLMDMLRLLEALAQPRYQYSVEGVDSNDILYGGDPQLLAEINSLADDVIKRVTSHLVSQSPLSRVQVCQAADLCLFLMRSADQRQQPISAAVTQLRRLCDTSDGLPPHYQAALRAAAAVSSRKSDQALSGHR